METLKVNKSDVRLVLLDFERAVAGCGCCVPSTVARREALDEAATEIAKLFEAKAARADRVMIAAR